MTVGESVGGKAKAEAQLTPTEKAALSLVPAGQSIWVRPAYDGLRVFVSGEKEVRDEAYD